MLRIDWDSQTTPYVDNSAYITIRTGRSRSYGNVINGLGVREPARGGRIRQDIELLLRKVSEKGGEAMAIPNVPEMVVVKFDKYEVAIVHGIIFTSVSLHGRLIGEYKLVVVMLEELDACLTDEFKIERYVQAALAAR
jgi:hypothetical protein